MVGLEGPDARRAGQGLMPRVAAVPFHLRKSSDTFSATTVTSTTEVVHGLLRLEGDRLVVQWRRARHTERMGAASYRTDEELEAVREHVIPLSGVAGAAVRRRWWEPWAGPALVLRAADLRAFEEVAGEGGLRLAHPAELVLRVRRADVLLAEEFAAELALALAERALAEAERRPTLPEGGPATALPGSAGEATT